MYQNKIEKFTDRLFLKSTTTRSPINNLSLNFKTLSPHSKRKSTQQNLISHDDHRSHFRQSKLQLGLSKTDIDKLELMCADLTAQDYLNKLIKIHEEERAMKDEVEIFGLCQDFAKETNNDLISSESKKSQNDSLEQTSKLLLTEKDQPALEDNFIKITVKPQKEHEKQEKTQRKDKQVKKTITFADKSSKNKQFLFVNKSPGKQSLLKKKATNITSSAKKTSVKCQDSIKQVQQSKESAQTPEVGLNRRSSVKSMKVGTSSPSLPLDQLYRIQAKSAFHRAVEQVEHEQGDKTKLNHKQFEQKEVSDSKKLQEICYSEIGKRMVTVHEKQVRRQFFKTNLHIRSYIMKNIICYIQSFAEYSPNSIFIFPNQRALHFEASQKPRELQTHLQHTKYVEIIKNVNHIIQKNIFKQKYKQKVPSSWPYTMIIMFLLLMAMLGLIVFVGDESTQLKNIFMVCTGLLICIILVVLIAHSLHCYSKKANFIPVCEIICQDIDSYFKFVNGKMENDLEWIVGQSFYWLEVKIHENGYRRKTHPKTRHKQLRCSKLYSYQIQDDEVHEQS